MLRLREKSGSRKLLWKPSVGATQHLWAWGWKHCMCEVRRKNGGEYNHYKVPSVGRKKGFNGTATLLTKGVVDRAFKV